MSSPLTSRAALLQVLTKGPNFGQELVRLLDEATGGAVNMAEGSVYGSLRRLVRDGLVVVAGTISGTATRRPGPDRILYHLTPAGERAAVADRQAIALLLFGQAHGGSEVGAAASPFSMAALPGDQR